MLLHTTQSDRKLHDLEAVACEAAYQRGLAVDKSGVVAAFGLPAPPAKATGYKWCAVGHQVRT